LSPSGDIPATNQLDWIVYTNTSFRDGTISVPDGEYILSIFPANEAMQAGTGIAQVGFRIDSAPTAPPILKKSVAGNQLTITLEADQLITRFWNIESSTNLLNWSIIPNLAISQGGSYSTPMTLQNQFFRARMIP
jgi:hypothetical protein